MFGMEESYGCLPGTYARDKDAVAASMMLCEAAAYYKVCGKTLWDAMLDMYERYGYYQDEVFSITLKGKEGIEKIQSIMEYLRENPMTQIADKQVIRIRDYQKDTMVTVATNQTEPTGLAKSNVLYYDLEDAAWVCVRPSGTEPKLKVYYGIKGSSFEDAQKTSTQMKQYLKQMVDQLLS
jgi:phosphoglucomutase